jgi:cytidylate kinase
VSTEVANGPSFGGVVALDGPSGTGKSTVARRLAHRLGAQYLDTGAMYRAATVAVLDAALDPRDAAAVVSEVAASKIELSTEPLHTHTVLNGRNVDVEIRSAIVTSNVSAVSAIPGVRAILVDQQRSIIADGPTVAEGRDVGSVVWPQADLKVYLTASETVRAQRRASELGDVAVNDVAAALRRRDDLDSNRATSPLRRADGAREIDTSEMNIDEVVGLLTRLAIEVSESATRVKA